MITGKQVGGVFTGVRDWVGKYANPKVGGMDEGWGKDVLESIASLPAKSPVAAGAFYGGLAGGAGGVLSNDRDMHWYTGAAQGAFAGAQMTRHGLSGLGVAGAAVGGIYGMMSNDTSIMTGAFMGAGAGAMMRHGAAGKLGYDAGGVKAGFGSMLDSIMMDVGFGSGSAAASGAASQAARSASQAAKPASPLMLPASQLSAARAESARRARAGGTGGARGGGARGGGGGRRGGPRIIKANPRAPVGKRSLGTPYPARPSGARIIKGGSGIPKRNRAVGSRKAAKRPMATPDVKRAESIARARRSAQTRLSQPSRPPNRNQGAGSTKPAKSVNQALTPKAVSWNKLEDKILDWEDSVEPIMENLLVGRPSSATSKYSGRASRLEEAYSNLPNTRGMKEALQDFSQEFPAKSKGLSQIREMQKSFEPLSAEVGEWIKKYGNKG